MIRIAVGKRQRFEIFKRDGFTCQYCGRKPPEIVLEVDHVVAVSAGGSNDDHNLLTSCFDCNRGKADRPLSSIPASLDEKRQLIEERREQVKAYEEILQQERDDQEAKIDAVFAVFDYYFTGDLPRDFSRASVRNFLKHLPLTAVQEAMEIACERMRRGRVFRYFCGVCWRKIRGEAPE